ncbi:MAG: hypothetical protein KBT04_05665, partial [Bacteroidales bacterium]|nr:hypothetical protein [Candidatus Colimorpha onthohippi]
HHNTVEAMEGAGALFLPAAGHGDGDVGSYGNYWSSMAYGSSLAYGLYFGSGDLGTSYYLRFGQSVRLVCDNATVPTLTTTAATGVTATGAVSGGNITSDGGEVVTVRGVCWGTSSTPTVSSCLGKTTDGTGTGSFSSTITGLTDGTTYYVRAYATNSIGTAYGDAVSFTSAAASTAPQGALDGLFSVAESTQVRFAQGNLQYTTIGTHSCSDGTTKDGTWRFAEHQYDCVDTANENVSSSYIGWIDLFGWGTSGYNGCNPYLSTTSYSDYGSEGDFTVSNVNYDWGVYNAISNGGNMAGKWRTLTKAEWDYLCSTRTNADSKRGYATVNGVHGVVFLPDCWTIPSGCTFISNYMTWGDNSYTAAQWAAMEAAGALFLPAAGHRYGTMIHGYGGDFGSYWFSSADGNSRAYAFPIHSLLGLITGADSRSNGFSVRLVYVPASVPTLTTTVATNITATGAVLGGIITSSGGEVVTARGVCWGTSSTPTISNCLGKTTDGIGTGSFSSTITGLTDGTTYYVRAYATNNLGTAYGSVVSFTATASSVPQGALNGLFSVAEGKQVRFAQGNLQYTTTGTHACADGTIKQGTWRFAEHQYDYVGSASQLNSLNQGNVASGNVSGSDNANVSSSYTGWIDLFGWGTSGHNGCNPYLSTNDNSYYGPSGSNNLTGIYANYDWGVYNAISNGGNVAGKWRTLTNSEWEYLLNTRTDASSKWGIATVNGVHGVVFLPDSWTLPGGCTFTSDHGSEWASNNYSTTQWEVMESAGALFLPAAGSRGDRYGAIVCDVGRGGNYWSTADDGICCAFLLQYNYVAYVYGTIRPSASSVRLVCD